jgi:serine protease AprX
VNVLEFIGPMTPPEQRKRGKRMKALCSLMVILVSLFVMAGLAAEAPAGVIASDLGQILNSTGADEELPVIITFRNAVDLNQFKGVRPKLRRPLIIKALRERMNLMKAPVSIALQGERARKVLPLWVINGMAMQARPALIKALAKIPGVESVRLDYVITLPEDIPGAPEEAEWNINTIGAAEMWALGFTGQGVVVANMDSGVDYLHNDLYGRWRGGSNSWFDPYGEHSTPYDSHTYSHGTGTMGIMVGGDAGGTSIGVAPGAQWIAVKVFDDDGDAYMSRIHQGFQWLLDPDGDPGTDDAPNVVNNSWTYDAPGLCISEFQTDIESLRTSGIAVVFAAGNNGPEEESSASPANNSGAFSVGAVDSLYNIASFSARGPSACDGSIFPYVVAPGKSIRTSCATTSGQCPDFYDSGSGTSFAAPHVAGAMALLLSAFPDLSVAQMEQALIDSAIDLGDSGPDNTYGYGMIDVFQAYNLIAASSESCKGDINGDSGVDEADLQLFLVRFGEMNCNDGAGCAEDLDGDGSVDVRDLNILASEFGRLDCPIF